MSEEKETIINGIDISECSYYNKDNKPYCCELWDNECEAQNCHFKQLKRLQKENEELKEMLSKEPKAMQAFQTAYSGLKKDNEVLWGMVKDYKTALEEIRSYCDEQNLKADYTACYITNRIDEVLNNRN